MDAKVHAPSLSLGVDTLALSPGGTPSGVPQGTPDSELLLTNTPKSHGKNVSGPSSSQASPVQSRAAKQCQLPPRKLSLKAALVGRVSSHPLHVLQPNSHSASGHALPGCPHPAGALSLPSSTAKAASHARVEAQSGDHDSCTAPLGLEVTQSAQPGNADEDEAAASPPPASETQHHADAIEPTQLVEATQPMQALDIPSTEPHTASGAPQGSPSPAKDGMQPATAAAATAAASQPPCSSPSSPCPTEPVPATHPSPGRASDEPPESQAALSPQQLIKPPRPAGALPDSAPSALPDSAPVSAGGSLAALHRQVAEAQAAGPPASISPETGTVHADTELTVSTFCTMPPGLTSEQVGPAVHPLARSRQQPCHQAFEDNSGSLPPGTRPAKSLVWLAARAAAAVSENCGATQRLRPGVLQRAARQFAEQQWYQLGKGKAEAAVFGDIAVIDSKLAMAEARGGAATTQARNCCQATARLTHCTVCVCCVEHARMLCGVHVMCAWRLLFGLVREQQQ